MDMTGMEGMTATTDVTGMAGMTSVSASSTSHTVLATAANTPTLLASVASDTTLSDEADVSSSAAIMDSMDSMSGMSNAFHFGVGDALWATPLTPTTGQGYAGAIILLILMALFLRCLTKVRSMAEKRWNPKRSSRYDGDEGDDYLKMGQSREGEAEAGSGHRWNITIQLTRALFQVTTVAIGYILMLAVMTFNAGYLLAILTGSFLGELALG
ncbi:Copper transport protein [Fusarium keratoplasticum]|nr:Copper transport protein [Fusarium keratoplasticum]